jgi:hypothetical protein
MGDKPSVPKYDVNQAQAEQNRINQATGQQMYADVVSPLGGYRTSVDPVTGKITIDKQLSDVSQLAQQQQLATLGTYTGDPTSAADAYYKAQMAYLQPQMQRQVERAESSLTNRGLPIGSSAWNEAMEGVYDAQNRSLESLTANALAQGQQYQNNILNQAAMLGSQIIDPTMVSGQAGTGLESTYDKQFQSEVEAWKQEQANKQALIGGIAKLGGAAIGGALGGPIGAGLASSLFGSATDATTK